MDETFYFYTDLNSSVLQSCTVGEAIENLKKREKIIRKVKNSVAVEQHELQLIQTPVFEFVRAEQKLTKAYFDFDIPRDQLGIPDQLQLLAHITRWTAECFAIEPHLVRYYDSENPNKLSLHGIINLSATRAINKEAAKQLASFIHRKLQNFQEKWVDTVIYGISQKFRCVYSAKRHRNNWKLPDQFANPNRYDVEADILHSFITVVPSSMLQLNNRITAHTTQIAQTFSDKLCWFDLALNLDSLHSFWTQKSSAYETWIVVGQSLFVESTNTDNLEFGKALWLKFSKLNTHVVNDEELITMFNQKWRQSDKDLFNLIKKWVKDHNATIADSLKKGVKDQQKTSRQLIQFPSFDVEPYEPELIPEFNFATHHQYIIGQHLISSNILRGYWKELLGKGDFYPLTGLCNDEEFTKYANLTEDCFVNYKQSFDKKLLPYKSFQNNNLMFYQWVCAILNLTYVQPAQQSSEFEAETAFQSYLERAEEIDPTAILHVDYIARFGDMETRDYQSQILKIARCEQLQFQSQYPYWEFLRELYLCAANLTIFWLLFSKVCGEFLKFDTEFHYLTLAKNACTAAEIVINIYPFIRYSHYGEIFVYDEVLGYWSQDEKIKLSLITKFSVFMKLRDGNFGETDRTRECVLKFIETSQTLRERGHEDFQKAIFTSRTNLLFRNGIYFGLQGQFEPNLSVIFRGKTYSFFHHPEIMFFGKIENEYKDLTLNDEADFNDMRNVYFTGMHGEEIGKYWQQHLGLCLFGIPFKGFFEHIGDPNSGKSTELAILASSFNSYVCEGQTSFFELKKMDNRPESRQQQFLVDNWFKRAMLISEITSADSLINSNRVKKFASGGLDKPRASKLYQNDADFDVFFLIFWYVNKALVFDDLKDKGIYERRNTITWRKVYVNNITDEQTQLLKRQEVQMWHTDKRRQLLYNHLIIEGFRTALQNGYIINKPLSLISELDEENVNSSTTTEDMVERLLKYCIITGNSKQYITSATLKDILTNKCELLPDKCLPVIKTYLKNKNVTIKSEQSRINGSRVQVWRGLESRASFIHNDLAMLIGLDDWKNWMVKSNGCISDIDYNNLSLIEGFCTNTTHFGEPTIDLAEKYGSVEQRQYLDRTYFNRNKRNRVEA